LVLDGDGEVGPIEERVPDAEVELFLEFLYVELLDVYSRTVGFTYQVSVQRLEAQTS
jgi:hypothetical protein